MTDTPKEPPPPDQPTLWNELPETDEPETDEPETDEPETDEPAAEEQAADSSPWVAEPDEPVSWNEPSGQWPEAEAEDDEPAPWDEPAARWYDAEEPAAPETSAVDSSAWVAAPYEPESRNEPSGQADEPAATEDEPAALRSEAEEPAARESEAAQPIPLDLEKRKRISGAGVVIGLLLALLGFALVVQVKSNTTDNAYASAREGDLLQIMSDLDGAERRLQQDIASLQATKRELASGAAGQEAAQEAAKARADDLGILAGTLQARGPGVEVRIDEVTGTIKASSLLNAVQELRGGGAEAIQIDGTGGSVRVIASTSFVDSDGGIRVDGRRLTGPYTIIAIGDPDTLSDAVQFAGGVVPRVRTDGGNVIVNKKDMVEIKEVRPAPSLEFARPVS